MSRARRSISARHVQKDAYRRGARRGRLDLHHDGDKYLDLYGGHAVAGTGHCHPHVVQAIREQAEKLLFYSNLVYSDARARR